jgi:hypothetical protein
MRHVFVKAVLEAMLVLSGKVTSATKAARLAQSGALVGIGMSTVNVGTISTACVSVAVGGISVGAAVCTGGLVTTGEVGSAAFGAPQAEAVSIVMTRINSSFFFMEASLTTVNFSGFQTHYIHNQP